MYYVSYKGYSEINHLRAMVYFVLHDPNARYY